MGSILTDFEWAPDVRLECAQSDDLVRQRHEQFEIGYARLPVGVLRGKADRRLSERVRALTECVLRVGGLVLVRGYSTGLHLSGFKGPGEGSCPVNE
jgi:hypothetical protein